MGPEEKDKARKRRARLLADKADCLQRMTDEARQIFEKEVAPAIRTGTRPAVLGEVWASDYAVEPVEIEDFVYDRRFLGGSLKQDIYPTIVDDLVDLFQDDYVEVCLGGGVGWGKTRLAQIAIAYEIYLLSCMRDPAAAFRLISGSTLAFVNISVDKTQAQRVLFAGLYGLIKRSPYFYSEFPFERRLRSELRFRRKNIRCYPVTASESGILGEGVFSAAFDEMNFMARVERSRRSVPGDTGIYDQAAVLANKLGARIRSRFNLMGKLPGHIYYISSARYPNDFTERKEAEAKNDPTIFVRHRALWESRPRSFFMRESFKVEVGDLTRRTRVLDGTETDVTGVVIEVPMDFHKPFVKDPDKAVRDLAGYSVLSVTPFIPRREMIRKMFDLGKEAGLRHPFSKVDVRGYPLDVTLQEVNPETEVIVPEHLHYVQRQKVDSLGRLIFEDGQRTRPVMEKVLFPAPYYAHLDLAKNRDAAGLVITHTIATKQVERFDVENMEMVKETLPITRVDLVLRIVNPPQGEIDIPRIRAILHQLRDQVGMQFGLITLDQYQSQESIKALNDAGFTADLFSVDDDFTAYDMLKQALYDERVACYSYPLLERELATLERTPKKVDHPAVAGSSKDLSDALAGALHHAEEGWRKGAGVAGLFKLGLVGESGAAPMREVEDRQALAFRNVVEGLPYDVDDIFGI